MHYWLALFIKRPGINFNRRTVARYTKDYGKNKIPHFKVGHLLKFKKENLEDWLKKKKMEEKEIL